MRACARRSARFRACLHELRTSRRDGPGSASSSRAPAGSSGATSPRRSRAREPRSGRSFATRRGATTAGSSTPTPRSSRRSRSSVETSQPGRRRGRDQDREVVFHLGALIPIPYSYRHPREFVTANVVGTLNVLEAARNSGADALVHTSTSEVYGTAQTVPIDEEHALHPQSPYAASKSEPTSSRSPSTARSRSRSRSLGRSTPSGRGRAQEP